MRVYNMLTTKQLVAIARTAERTGAPLTSKAQAALNLAKVQRRELGPTMPAVREHAPRVVPYFGKRMVTTRKAG